MLPKDIEMIKVLLPEIQIFKYSRDDQIQIPHLKFQILKFKFKYSKDDKNVLQSN